MKLLSEERFYQSFRDYVESETEEETEENIKIKNIKNKDSNLPNKESDEALLTSPERIDVIADTLSPEEKKKRKRDKDSESRRRSWGAKPDIKTQPDGYEDLKSLSRGVVKEKKKKKPDCKAGAKWHESLGRFSSKEDAKSWSGGYSDSNKSDCLAGKFKSKGDGRKYITKHPCGKKKGGGKEKYKCKDSLPNWKTSVVEESQIDLSPISTKDLVDELERRLNQINEGGNMTTYEILRLCSQINAAAKGDFPKKK